MDLLFKNCNIITMTDEGIVKNGFIGITNGEIVYLSETAPQDPAKRTVDLGGKLILPGFINTHTHAAMTLMRGVADDLSLQNWLNNHIFPIEEKLTSNSIYHGTLAALCEMIASGTTTFCDMYFLEDAVAKATEQSKIRAHLSRCLSGMEDLADYSEKPCVREAHELTEKYKNHDRIKIDTSVHAIYTSSPRFLEYAAELAFQNKSNMHIHISETEFENNECKTKYGLTPTQYLCKLGYFRTNTYAAHCVYLEEKDIEIFAENGVSIAHNPTSNLKLASGIAPITTYMSKGINVSLGTDGAASNNNLNMLNEVRLAALLHKGTTKNPCAVSAKDALSMATTAGATAIGRTDIGSLKLGNRADLIVVDQSMPNMTPMFDQISAIVYSASAENIVSTMVDGEFLMENKEFKTLDFEKIRYNINNL